jgi:hypothetical protein
MDGYAIMLFLHLCALLGAIGTAALLHFAELRLRAADNVAAIRAWARLIENGAKVFPVALLVLLASGAYLVDRHWSWGAGWVDAALVGVGVLFAVGAGVIGGRSRALGRELRDVSDDVVTPRLARLARNHVAGIASWSNTGVALGVVFVMTTKPGLAGSLACLAVGAGFGVAVAWRLRRIGGAGV